MDYYSVSQMADKWGISERSVRNYCANGRVQGAFLTGKTWNIPENAVKPEPVSYTHLDVYKRQQFSRLH